MKDGVEEMKILNITTHSNSSYFQSGIKTQDFVKEEPTIQAVSIQGNVLLSFLANPFFIDGSGRCCPVLLADSLRI
jgi:hypothetical protein